ncbi:MAG: glucosamine inositolphosphorylceramide transferase family protein, partial [Limisphaerales bacterium]
VLPFEKFVLRLYAHHKDHLATVDLRNVESDFAQAIPILTITDADEPKAKEIERLKAFGIDVLVNFRSLPVPEPIVRTSRLGAMRLDFRGERLGSTAPVGFWEPYLCTPKTKFSLLCTDSDEKTERLVLEGSFRTQFTHLLNQAHLYTKALAQLKQTLLRIAVQQKMPPTRLNTSVERMHYAAPTSVEKVSYALRLAGRLSRKACRRILNIRQKWGIRFAHTGWRDTTLLRAKKTAAPAGHFWADPFLYVHQGHTYCFVEDYLYSTKRAHISVLEISEKKVTNLGVALAEDFHLSFPFLFNYDGNIYMSPECSEARQIRIYKAKSFPLEWELCSIPMQNISAADSMFFERDGKWWLMTSIDRTELNDHCSELCLFWADSPLSDQWTAHPQNPIYVDVEGGRNAGLIIEKRKILRAAQKQGFDQYGRGLSVYEILKLDQNSYQEVKIADYEKLGLHDSLGSHHISTTGDVTVVDYLNRRFAP